MTDVKVTNEWVEAEIADLEKNGLSEGDAICVAALRELLSRRQAEEGAVTVEGWMPDHCLDATKKQGVAQRRYGPHYWPLTICATKGQGQHKRSPVTVTIRKRGA